MESLFVALFSVVVIAVPYWLWGRPAAFVVFGLLLAFHLGFRIAKGRWMNQDGS